MRLARIRFPLDLGHRVRCKGALVHGVIVTGISANPDRGMVIKITGSCGHGCRRIFTNRVCQGAIFFLKYKPYFGYRMQKLDWKKWEKRARKRANVFFVVRLDRSYTVKTYRLFKLA